MCESTAKQSRPSSTLIKKGSIRTPARFETVLCRDILTCHYFKVIDIDDVDRTQFPMFDTAEYYDCYIKPGQVASSCLVLHAEVLVVTRCYIY